jgi:hypothetical protein
MAKKKIKIEVKPGATSKPLSQVVAEVRAKRKAMRGKKLYKSQGQLNVHIHGIRP